MIERLVRWVGRDGAGGSLVRAGVAVGGSYLAVSAVLAWLWIAHILGLFGRPALDGLFVLVLAGTAGPAAYAAIRDTGAERRAGAALAVGVVCVGVAFLPFRVGPIPPGTLAGIPAAGAPDPTWRRISDWFAMGAELSPTYLAFGTARTWYSADTGWWVMGYSVATVGTWRAAAPPGTDIPRLVGIGVLPGSVAALAGLSLLRVLGVLSLVPFLVLSAASVLAAGAAFYRAVGSGGRTLAAGVGLALVIGAFLVLIRPATPCENLFVRGTRVGPLYLMTRGRSLFGIDTAACTHWVNLGLLAAGVAWLAGAARQGKIASGR